MGFEITATSLKVMTADCSNTYFFSFILVKAFIYTQIISNIKNLL